MSKTLSLMQVNETSTLKAVSPMDFSALSVFVKNSAGLYGGSPMTGSGMGTINPATGAGGGTRMAEVEIDLFMDDFLDGVVNHINYVSKGPKFQVTEYDSDDFIQKEQFVDTKHFDSVDGVIEFIVNNKHKTLVVFTLVQRVDLKTLTREFIFRYKFLENKRVEREALISDIIDNFKPEPKKSDYEDDLPF